MQVIVDGEEASEGEEERESGEEVPEVVVVVEVEEHALRILLPTLGGTQVTRLMLVGVETGCHKGKDEGGREEDVAEEANHVDAALTLAVRLLLGLLLHLHHLLCLLDSLCFLLSLALGYVESSCHPVQPALRCLLVFFFCCCRIVMDFANLLKHE